jgi:hypothetical protein
MTVVSESDVATAATIGSPAILTTSLNVSSVGGRQ